MNIIFTCVGNFQEYLLVNIQQLILLGHSPETIHVITNRRFFEHFTTRFPAVRLFDVDELPNTYRYNERTALDHSFRNSFWVFTSARFFYIYECMRKYNIENVIHLENDVVIYYNISTLLPYLKPSRIYMPLDTYTRNIASIVFIPNHRVLESVLNEFDLHKNDMENFAKHVPKGNVDNLPIFCEPESSMNETAFVSRNYRPIPFLFDAAAMGQYLGGVDPLNIHGDTKGFVNETCVVKYDQYKFVWSNHITQSEIYQPFLLVNESLHPIFNLHIHSKTLNRFTSTSVAPFYNPFFAYHSNAGLIPAVPRMSYKDAVSQYNYTILDKQCNYDKFIATADTSVPLFDIMVPVGPDDVGYLETYIGYIRNNVMGYRNIYLIMYDDSIQPPNGCIAISEKIFPFSKKDISNAPLYPNREGWYLQQLLKIYALFVIPGILDNMLVIDSDTVFLRPIHFIHKNKCILGYSQEYHPPYFTHMNKLHPTFTKMDPDKSGIVHYMMFQRKYLKKLMNMVENTHPLSFWEVFLKETDSYQQSGASEYELYFHFMLQLYSDQIELRELTSKWVLYYKDIPKQNADVVSCHSYSRRSE